MGISLACRKARSEVNRTPRLGLQEASWHLAMRPAAAASAQPLSAYKQPAAALPVSRLHSLQPPPSPAGWGSPALQLLEHQAAQTAAAARCTALRWSAHPSARPLHVIKQGRAGAEAAGQRKCSKN